MERQIAGRNPQIIRRSTHQDPQYERLEPVYIDYEEIDDANNQVGEWAGYVASSAAYWTAVAALTFVIGTIFIFTWTFAKITTAIATGTQDTLKAIIDNAGRLAPGQPTPDRRTGGTINIVNDVRTDGRTHVNIYNRVNQKYTP